MNPVPMTPARNDGMLRGEFVLESVTRQECPSLKSLSIRLTEIVAQTALSAVSQVANLHRRDRRKGAQPQVLGAKQAGGG